MPAAVSDSRVIEATTKGFDGWAGRLWTFLHTNPIAWRLYGWFCWGAHLPGGEREVESRIASWRGGTLVDVPAGIGRLFGYYRDVVRPERLVAFDIAPAMVERAKESAARASLEQAECLVANIESLPLPDGCADHLVSEGGFHHFPDRRAAIAEMLRVLKPGGSIAGYCLVSGANPMGTISFWLFHRRGLMGTPLRQRELEEAFREAGVSDWRGWRTGSLLVFSCSAP